MFTTKKQLHLSLIKLCIVNLTSSFLFSAQSDYLEVWLDLHLNNTESMNLTLFGRYNPSTLQLHLSDDEGDGDGGEDDEGPREVSLYCLPSLDTANPSHCLLWLSRQTLAGAKAGLPWKRTTNG